MKQLFTLFVILAIMLSGSLQAQGVFERVLKKTGDRVGKRVEDNAAEKLSDVINRKINDKIDEAFEGEEETETTEPSYDSVPGYPGGNPDESFGQLEEMMGAMMKSDVELPAQYEFDIDLKIRVTDEQGVNYMHWLTNKDIGHFAIGDFKGENVMGEEPSFMVMDTENGVMVNYAVEDGQKKGIKLPSMMPGATEMAKEDIEADMESIELGDLSMLETGRHPLILGHNCTEYKIDHEEEDEYSLMVMSNDGSMKWASLFGNMSAMPYLPNMPYYNVFRSGMMMRIQTFDKSSNEMTSEMEVVEINKNPAPIINSEWEFAN